MPKNCYTSIILIAFFKQHNKSYYSINGIYQISSFKLSSVAVSIAKYQKKKH